MCNIASIHFSTHQTKHEAGWAAQYPMLRDAMTLFNLKKRERVHLDLRFEQSAAVAHQCNSRLPTLTLNSRETTEVEKHRQHPATSSHCLMPDLSSSPRLGGICFSFLVLKPAKPTEDSAWVRNASNAFVAGHQPPWPLADMLCSAKTVASTTPWQESCFSKEAPAAWHAMELNANSSRRGQLAACKPRTFRADFWKCFPNKNAESALYWISHPKKHPQPTSE